MSGPYNENKRTWNTNRFWFATERFATSVNMRRSILSDFNTANLAAFKGLSGL